MILNPSAGSGRAGARLDAFAPWLDVHARDWSAVATEAPGDAERLAAEASRQGFGLVVAAGGDGTASEVVNGLLAGDGGAVPCFACLPLGTGCDFARGLGWARALPPPSGSRVRRRRVDVGVAAGAGTTRHFVNAVNVGVGAIVAERLRREAGVRRLGPSAYLVAGVAVLRRSRPVPLQVTVEGREVGGRLINVSICNGRYMGGGMSPCPGARVDDGRLHVACIERLPAHAVIKLALAVLGKRGLRDRRIAVHEGRSVALAGAAAVELDGDPWGVLPARFAVRPAALEVLVPELASG